MQDQSICHFPQNACGQDQHIALHCLQVTYVYMVYTPKNIEVLLNALLRPNGSPTSSLPFFLPYLTNCP